MSTGTVQLSAPQRDLVNYHQTLPQFNRGFINVIDDLLTSFKKDGESILDKNQIERLMEITLSNGRKFFSINGSNDADNIYMILGDFIKYSFNEVYEALTRKKYDTLEEYIFYESPGMKFSRYKSKIDIEIFKNKIETVPGSFTCGKCQSEETIATEMQTRSADEPMTVFVTCVMCDNHWKV